MRPGFVGCTFALAILASTSASASENHASPVTAYAPSTLGGTEVVPVDPGQDIAIQCDGIGAPGVEVNVVMKLDPVLGETPTGFDAVLLTEESIGGQSVHVRVPNMLALVNHTVTLEVYVVGAHSTTACDAGHLRIG